MFRKGAVLMSRRLFELIRRSAMIPWVLSLLTFLSISADRALAVPAPEESVRPQSLLVKLPSGITLNYLVQGNPRGIPVVLLHGAGDSWHSYDLVLPRLPDTTTPVSPTFRLAVPSPVFVARYLCFWGLLSEPRPASRVLQPRKTSRFSKSGSTKSNGDITRSFLKSSRRISWRFRNARNSSAM